MDELGAQMIAGLPPELQEGSADHFSNAVSALCLTDGNIPSPPMPGITAIVGPNRSGLIAGRVLMQSGKSASEAIETLRTMRSRACLCNPSFEAWLRLRKARRHCK